MKTPNPRVQSPPARPYLLPERPSARRRRGGQWRWRLLDRLGWRPWAFGAGPQKRKPDTVPPCPRWRSMREPGLCGHRLLTSCLTSWRQGSLWGRPDPPSGVMCPRLERRRISGCSLAVVRPSTGDLQSLENRHRDSHSLGPEGLSLLWARAASPVEQAVAALANLSWLLFLRGSEAVSITPAGLASDSVVLFVTTKVGGHRKVRRPLYEWGRSWVQFLRSYAAASCVPEGQPLVRGGVEAVEKIFADLLRDSPYSDHRWHSLRRGGAAAAFHRSPNVAYFVWWGRRKRLATALEYALGYSDPLVLWCFHGLWVARLLVSGWLCCWPTCGVTPCMLIPKGIPRRRRWQSLHRCLRGLSYLFLIWMWHRIKGKWTMWSLIRIPLPSPRSLRPPPCPQQAPVAPPRSPHRPLVWGNALCNSRREPDLRSGAAR